MNRALTVLLAFVTLAVILHAQEPVDLAMVAKIRDEGLNRSQVMDTFNYLTTVIGPRLTASPAFTRAVNWTGDRMQAMGLANVHLEPFEFGRGWTLDRFSADMLEPRYFPLIGYPNAWSPSTNGRLVGRPVWLGDKTPDEIATYAGKLAGAIVLARPLQTYFERKDRPRPRGDPPGMPAQNNQPAIPAPTPAESARAQILAGMLPKERVGALLEPNRGEFGTIFVTGRDQGENGVPTVVLAAEHYNLLVRMLQQHIPVRVAVDLQARFNDEDRNAYNVIGELAGTDRQVGDEVVMVGAHIDSWHAATGSSDNADGVSVALEALRILKTVGVRPKRTIRVAIWGGEEQGLLGSRAYVKQHLSGPQNQQARDRFSVYFNLDNGAMPIYGFYLEGNQAIRPIMQRYLEPFKDLGANVLTIQGIGATDHLSFRQEGLPGFQAIHDYTNYDVHTHHTNMDTNDHVEEQSLRQGAVVMASILYHAAMRNERMPR
jgi:hypothetical protein